VGTSGAVVTASYRFTVESAVPLKLTSAIPLSESAAGTSRASITSSFSRNVVVNVVVSEVGRGRLCRHHRSQAIMVSSLRGRGNAENRVPTRFATADQIT